MIKTSIIPFHELGLDRFYEILALRSQVFIVEQQCVYQDLDYKDQHAQHLLVQDNNKLIAYARILPYDEEAMSFGRLVTAPSHRGLGIGKQLMDLIVSHLHTYHPTQLIIITAQYYLHDFYRNYGFEAQGEPFDMDGILHIRMVKKP